jgi:hypothetical protein
MPFGFAQILDLLGQVIAVESGKVAFTEGPNLDAGPRVVVAFVQTGEVARISLQADGPMRFSIDGHG